MIKTALLFDRIVHAPIPIRLMTVHSVVHGTHARQISIRTPAHVPVRDRRLRKERAVFMVHRVIIAAGEHGPDSERERRTGPVLQSPSFQSPSNHDDITTVRAKDLPLHRNTLYVERPRRPRFG